MYSQNMSITKRVMLANTAVKPVLLASGHVFGVRPLVCPVFALQHQGKYLLASNLHVAYLMVSMVPPFLGIGPARSIVTAMLYRRASASARGLRVALAIDKSLAHIIQQCTPNVGLPDSPVMFFPTQRVAPPSSLRQFG
jgi:hypothetical protein